MNEYLYEYLDKGNEIVLDAINLPVLSVNEKKSVVNIFTNHIERAIGKTVDCFEIEFDINNALFEILKTKLQVLLNKQVLNKQEHSSALVICNKLNQLQDFFINNKKMIDDINVATAVQIIQEKYSDNSECDSIIEIDKSISAIFTKNDSLTVDHCDKCLKLFDDLEEKINYCESKNIDLPVITNVDIAFGRSKINYLKASVIERTKCFENLKAGDDTLSNMMNSWQGDIQFINTILSELYLQKNRYDDCIRRGWKCPKLIHDPSDCITQYQHYELMMKVDSEIADTNYHDLDSKSAEHFMDICRKLNDYIEICNINKWKVPNLKNSNPSFLVQECNEAQNSKRIKKTQRAQSVLIWSAILVFLVLFSALLISLLPKRIKIPYSSNEVVGLKYGRVVNAFERAGFDNVNAKETNEGYLPEGEVVSVLINDQTKFREGNTFLSNSNIVVFYSSRGRTNITSLVNKWKTDDYHTVMNLLKACGYHVEVEIVEGSSNNDDRISSIKINGMDYEEGDCYVPSGCTITLYVYQSS